MGGFEPVLRYTDEALKASALPLLPHGHDLVGEVTLEVCMRACFTQLFHNAALADKYPVIP